MSSNTNRLEAFRRNGKKIAHIRDTLLELIQTEHNLQVIESTATQMIKEAGGQPAFKKVPGYRWSTCISVNDCIVHGIPKGKAKKGDIVTIDIGMYYKKTTTDTAKTVVIGKPTNTQAAFLEAGKNALEQAIAQAKPGNTIKDVSRAMQQAVESGGFNVSRDLVGHGLGETMHEKPAIPCYVSHDPQLLTKLIPGMVLAIEVMYMAGGWQLYTKADGWGMHTKDGSIAGQFEHDVIITNTGNQIITA